MIFPYLSSCPRCGKRHKNLKFKVFTKMPDAAPLTHWALCPRTKQPILMYHDDAAIPVINQDDAVAQLVACNQMLASYCIHHGSIERSHPLFKSMRDITHVVASKMRKPL